MFASGFSEGIPVLKGDTGENTDKKRVITTEIEFHTLHNILYYLYTDQITLHSKPGREPTIGPRTVDVQSIYEAADQFLLPRLKDKAQKFLDHTCDIQNITARVFGEFSRKHELLNLIYSYFFRSHLPLIVQTIEFHDYFNRLEGCDADQANARFRKLVQESICGKTGIIGKCIKTESDEDDEDDADYEPDDDKSMEECGEGQEEDEEDEDGEEIESSEESSDEEEE